MDLLLFFAIPVATILLAIVWQRLVRSPTLVALTAFAIFLVITFAVFDSSFLINAIIYTILAYIAAWIARFVCENIGRNGMFRNISAENIRTDTLSTNTLEVNENDNNEENSQDDCSCNRYVKGYNRGYYRRW